MTLAICQHCGAEKFGALTRCPACDYCPMSGSDRDVALAMLFSDHYFNRENLQALGQNIAAGVDVTVDQDVIDTMAQRISAYMNTMHAVRPPKSSKSWWRFWKK